RDFAIIEHVALDWQPGMTALTGETGAGKSILLDAIALVLGGRADSNSVREGAKRTDIAASFDLRRNTGALAWLQSHDLDDEDTCVLRRVVGVDGRSRAYINGRATTAASLRELGAKLVQILGQHEHQRLTDHHVQRRIVDACANHDAALKRLANCYRQWRETSDRLSQVLHHCDSRAQRIDLLSFQLQELEQLPISSEEIQALQAEHVRLGNAERLLSLAGEALQCSYEAEHSAHQNLSVAVRAAESLAATDERASAVAELFNEALINLDEAATTLRDYASHVELDPARLSWVEEQLDTLQRLSRKHRCESHELPALRESIQAELNELQSSDSSTEELQQQASKLRSDYLRQAHKISAARAKAAKKLSDRVTKTMSALGMGGGKFVVELSDDPERASSAGIDRIELLVSANPGQSPRPLARVASGGELSRISLAIQMIASHYAPVPSMIFDEVDSGVGGGVAEIVGGQLRDLGERCQVMCVTHLPQVASQAHQHVAVRKVSDNNYTQTEPRLLDKNERIEEIARMLGGVKVTTKVRSHAREMLACS
ncbi:MAG: DNA repair protein RecN, partial [Granulosicoccaceae bacterium]